MSGVNHIDDTDTRVDHLRGGFDGFGGINHLTVRHGIASRYAHGDQVQRMGFLFGAFGVGQLLGFEDRPRNQWRERRGPRNNETDRDDGNAEHVKPIHNV